VVATSLASNWIKWYENQSGSWATHDVDTFLLDAIWPVLVDADLDNDLDVIVAVNDNPGWIGWYRNEGTTWQDSTLGQLRGARSLALGDIDGDSYFDLVACGWGADSIVWFNTPFPTFINDDSEIFISKPLLYQNYPNPFNPVTVISLQLPVGNQVKLSVYTITGQRIATLVNRRYPAGYHTVSWDASNVANGIYFYRLQAADYVETKKMLLLR
jgi:hypothetical protein